MPPIERHGRPLHLRHRRRSYTIKWDDGDTDPTGSSPSTTSTISPRLQVDRRRNRAGRGQVDRRAHRHGGQICASCFCEGDMGVTCPRPARRRRQCANQLAWDTSRCRRHLLAGRGQQRPAVPRYSVGRAIRIAHGGTAAPAALLLAPTGSARRTTSTACSGSPTGKAPLKFDLAYGIEDTGFANTPMADIATCPAIDQRRRHLQLRLGHLGAGQHQVVLGGSRSPTPTAPPRSPIRTSASPCSTRAA